MRGACRFEREYEAETSSLVKAVAQIILGAKILGEVGFGYPDSSDLPDFTCAFPCGGS